MNKVCMDGLNKMHRFIECAPGDIQRRLWTLYWLARMTHTPFGCIVELGTRDGDSTRAILCSCQDMNEAMLYSYDIEDVRERVYQRTREMGVPFPEAPWCFNVMDSICAGIEWIRGTVDMLFIDTDHTYHTTSQEIQEWHRHVRVGGCICFHDYWLDEPDRPISKGVKPAVDEFYKDNKDEWQLETHDAYQDTGLAILWRTR